MAARAKALVCILGIKFTYFTMGLHFSVAQSEAAVGDDFRQIHSLVLSRRLHPPRRTPGMMLVTSMSTISDPSNDRADTNFIIPQLTPTDSDVNRIGSRADVLQSMASDAPSTKPSPTSLVLSWQQAEKLRSQMTSLQRTVASVRNETIIYGVRSVA
ncbi:uncharacterized protein EDB91DRAFT_288145 [Suillus paluster]|uniref:uncharacterized protein n=1 Tax=Suillus paluster TaxID=48578 RepID=UPI001B88495C|nr:uncharacterized protein EDB91DRAFT_288145 [Suillus paluster]KAG1742637.1 hypothetical protein EDB91DRAFT_288145 [Suillus paluster]